MNGARHSAPRSHSVSSASGTPLMAAGSMPPSASIFTVHRPSQCSTTIGGPIQQTQSPQWDTIGAGSGGPTNGGGNGTIGRGEESAVVGMGKTFVVRSNSMKKQQDSVLRRCAHQQQSHCGAWIEKVFQRRDCIKFIPADDHSDRCQCGRVSAAHSQLALSRFTASVVTRRVDSMAEGVNSDGLLSNDRGQWTIGGCTAGSPTDAYGIIQFQGGPHVHKAHYVRLSFDSEPADVVRLMERVWGLSRPRLVISVQGGTADFDVPERLGKVFREGLLKAAETTGAWVLTSGLDSGVVKHVARALDEAGISARMRSRIVTVGIAPWGLLQRRDQLIGHHSHVPYDRPHTSASSAGVILNDRHSYFLLADNGTVERYGADIVLRRRLEEYLANSRAQTKSNKLKSQNGHTTAGCRRRIPIVCVVLEGGLCTLNPVHRYLTGTPSIPVIVCEGSGRISDMLAFAAKHLDRQRNLPDEVSSELLARVQLMSCQSAPNARSNSSDAILHRILQCARNRDGLLTIFRLPSPQPPHRQCAVPSQMDQAILRALLHGQNLSPVDQLLLTLAWGREDIARREIFRQNNGRIGEAMLAKPMMEALQMGRVDFVKLFLEQGLSLKRFLTFERLEELYNAESTLNMLMNGGRKVAERGKRSQNGSTDQAFTLPEIGVAIERLMGNAFRSTYTTRAFKMRYERAKFGGIHPMRRSATRNFSSLYMCLGGDHAEEEEDQPAFIPRKSALASPTGGTSSSGGHEQQQMLVDFEHPFNELMLWAVLTRRHEMAKLFWQYGEEPMAKVLTAIRLYKCMSREAAHDYTEVEVSNQLRECANEFRECSLELLHHCHQQDSQLTMRLLTAELPNWGHHTCLSLAVIANNKRFLAHPCCQILLAELWHGGLRFRSQSNVKVVLGILFPPSILLLDFKPFSRADNNALDTLLSSDMDEEEDPLKGTLKGGKIFGKKCRNEGNGISGGNEEEQEHLLMLKGVHHRRRGTRNGHCDCARGHGEESISTELMDHPHQYHHPSPSSCSRLARLLSKFVLFYGAPITSFWIWCISFASFMLALIFVLLVEMPTNRVPTIEWFLFIYVLALAMEHFRKLFVLESSSLVEKLGVFYNRYWNILTTCAVLSYFVGFAFRFNPATVHTHARIILASNSVLWHMKLFDFLSVHPRIGPYITMAGKMVLAMSYIIVLLMVTLMAFGVARQSITFPHEKWAWILVRNIFYKPYFMLYGEVYAGEIDTCGDEGTNCVPGGWIPPVLMTIFLLVANILLVNMLIAIFNNIFNVTNAMSQQVWMFQRYDQVLEYKSTPILPPPLTPLAHLFMLIRHLCKSKQPACPLHANSSSGLTTAAAAEGDFALKVQLSAVELVELQDFEEDCMDDLSRRKYRNIADSTEESLVDDGMANNVVEEQHDDEGTDNALNGCPATNCCCATTAALLQKVLARLEARERAESNGGSIDEDEKSNAYNGTMVDSETMDDGEQRRRTFGNQKMEELEGVHGRSVDFALEEEEEEEDGQRKGKGTTVDEKERNAASGTVTRVQRVAPLNRWNRRPRNSSSMVNDDIEQMLAVLMRERKANEND